MTFKIESREEVYYKRKWESTSRVPPQVWSEAELHIISLKAGIVRLLFNKYFFPEMKLLLHEQNRTAPFRRTKAHNLT